MKLHTDYHGRIGRKEYWLGFLALMLTSFVLTLFLLLFMSLEYSMIINKIILFWPGFCLGTKRFHDCNMSGWWCLLNLIPYIGILITLAIQGFVEGSNGSNRFGPDPLQSPKRMPDTFYGQELKSTEA